MSRGDGQVFQRGKRWYIAYYGPDEDGRTKKFREVAGATEKAARTLLRERLRQVANDRAGLQKFTPPAAGRVRMEKLFDAVVEDYVLKGRKSLRTLKAHQAQPREVFGAMAASAVTAEKVRDYIAARLKKGAARATVDRETETIARAFSLANESGVAKLFAPEIPKTLQKNANARTGFLDRPDFNAILAAIPDFDFRDLLEFFYWTGMRPGEICSLTWANDDGENLVLAVADAKTGKARTIPYAALPQLAVVMVRRVAARHEKSALIFHRAGRTMAGTTGGFKRHLRELWRAACAKAKVEGAIPYDLRRTAVRNMTRGGASMATAMSISGHKTTDTFLRYEIVDTADRTSALRGAAAYVQTRAKDRKVLPFAKGNGPKDGPK